MFVDKYLEATRVLKKGPSLEEHYREYYKSICTMINIGSELPELKVCYSINRTCEMIEFNNKEYLIYDQYLGQSLNMLNRLYFNSKVKDEAKAYGYKFLAEKMYAMGRHKYSTIFAISHITLKEESSSYKTDIDIRKRAFYTYVQELFIMYHELAHWMLSKKEFSNLLNIKRDFLIESFDGINNLSPEFFAEGFLNDRHRALFDDGLSFRDFMSNAEFMKFSEKFRSEQINNGIKELILERDDIIEECLCDDIALGNLISFFSIRPDIEIKEIVKATFLGLQNLELLSIIDKSAIDFIYDNDNQVIGFINESIIRVSNFRNSIYMNASLHRKVKFGEYHEDLKKINVKYSELIKDPILFGLGDKIQIQKNEYDLIKLDDKESDLALRL